MDHAVARGAARRGSVYYAECARARASVQPCRDWSRPCRRLCVAPFGMEEGSEAPLPPQQLSLAVGESVRFRFFGSSVRREDQPGTLLDFWSPKELQELAQIEATLPADGPVAGEVVPVQLRARDRHRRAGVADARE